MNRSLKISIRVIAGFVFMIPIAPIVSSEAKYVASSDSIVSRHENVCPAQKQRLLTGLPWFPALSVSKNLNPKENYLAGIMPDGLIYIWALGSADRLGTIPDNQQSILPKSQVTSIALTSDGRRLASGLSQGQIILWDTLNRTKEVKIPRLELNGKARSISFDSNNQFLAAAYGEGKKAIVYDISRILNNKQNIEESETISKLIQNEDYYELVDDALTNTDPKIKTIADKTYVQSILFSPNNKLIVTSGSDKNFKLWSTQSWKLINSYPLQGSYQGALQLAFSPDSQVLATALAVNSAGEVRLWDVKDPSKVKLLNTFTGFTANVSSVAFSPNGQYLLAGSLDGTLKVWDWRANKIIFQQCGDIFGIRSVVFDPVSNDSFISESSLGAIKFWSISAVKSPYEVEKIILGIFLILYSLIALYVLYSSKQKLISFIKKVITHGRSVERSISSSTKLIDNFECNLKKIADDLSLIGSNIPCSEFSDEYSSITVEIDVTPVVTDIRDASVTIDKLEKQNEFIYTEVKKILNDIEGKTPKKPELFQLINPLYIFLMLLHVGLLVLGLWILSISLFNSSSQSSQYEASIVDLFQYKDSIENQVAINPFNE